MDAKIKIPLVIRDSVHNLIRIDCPCAVQLINSEPLQRLRRIKQLGLANLVYPGAEHTRFNHSLGVYHLAQMAMHTINSNLRALGKEEKFDAKKQTLVGLTALLHDVGHGPFSHMFERVAKSILRNKAIKHEKWTEKIIEEHDQVSGILQKASDRLYGGSSLIDDMKKVLNGIYKPDYVVDLLSSQMDMDRFDYLLRDSKNAGCHYGDFDIHWIFRALMVASIPKGKPEGVEEPELEVLAVEESKGRNCVEEYILGRHFMYIHLYYHKTIVAAENMLQGILKRAVDLIKGNDGLLVPEDYLVLKSFAAGENPSLDDYLAIDDTVVTSWLNKWTRCSDKILADLSRRLLCRNLFTSIHLPQSQRESRRAFEALKSLMSDRGYDPEYYLLDSELSDTAHKNYMHYLGQGKQDNFRDIHLVDSSKNMVYELSDEKRSVVIAGSSALAHDYAAWFIPKELKNDAKDLLKKLE